jgi:hypothetical protein
MKVGYILGPVVGAGATLLRVTLTGRRDDRIRREERDAGRREQLEQAMWRYLAASDALTPEATGEVPPRAFSLCVPRGSFAGNSLPPALALRCASPTADSNR